MADHTRAIIANHITLCHIMSRYSWPSIEGCIATVQHCTAWHCSAWYDVPAWRFHSHFPLHHDLGRVCIGLSTTSSTSPTTPSEPPLPWPPLPPPPLPLPLPISALFWEFWCCICLSCDSFWSYSAASGNTTWRTMKVVKRQDEESESADIERRKYGEKASEKSESKGRD